MLSLKFIEEIKEDLLDRTYQEDQVDSIVQILSSHDELIKLNESLLWANKDLIKINQEKEIIIKELIQSAKETVKSLMMKTMYDGSLGIMVDPDLSICEELQKAIKKAEGK